MAKAPKGPGLGDVVDQLKENNESNKGTRQAIQDFIKAQSRDKLKKLEDKLEASRGGRLAMGAGGLGANAVALTGKAAFSPLKGIASMFGTLVAPLAAGLTPLLIPLKALGGLLLKGGPIALVIGGMYTLFKDIAENPTFTKTMESIKATWNDKILPTFDSIKATINSIGQSEGVSNTFQAIGDFFSNFKIQIQDWVLGNLDIITSTISGVLDGVDKLLKGEWMDGLSTIGSSLFGGLKDYIDLTFTNFLEIFGVDFGADGTLFKFIGTKLNNVLTSMQTMWTNFTTGVTDTWDGLVNFFVGESGWVQTTLTTLKTSMVLKWTTFRDGVVEKWDAAVAFLTETIPSYFETMKTNLMTKWNDLVNVVTVDLPNKFTEIKDSIFTTVGNIGSEYIVQPITNAVDWVKEKFAIGKLMAFDLSQMVNEKWTEVTNRIGASLDAMKTWFSFIPDRIKLMLDEKWTAVKFKLQEGFLNFSSWVAGLPDSILGAALSSIQETLGPDSRMANWLGVNDAIAGVQERQAKTQNIYARAKESLSGSQTAAMAELAARRAALEEQMAAAMGGNTVIVQENKGGDTVNATTLNATTPSAADPYAASYMGARRPDTF